MHAKQVLSRWLEDRAVIGHAARAAALLRVVQALLLCGKASLIRRALVRRFPYGVFYVPGIDDKPDVVVAVVDLRLDPEVVRKAYLR